MVGRKNTYLRKKNALRVQSSKAQGRLKVKSRSVEETLRVRNRGMLAKILEQTLRQKR